jgi:hypothetical protein
MPTQAFLHSYGTRIVASAGSPRENRTKNTEQGFVMPNSFPGIFVYVDHSTRARDYSYEKPPGMFAHVIWRMNRKSLKARDWNSVTDRNCSGSRTTTNRNGILRL